MARKKPDYKLNIAENMDQYNEVLSVSSRADRDLPSSYLTSREEFETFVFMTSLAGNQMVEIPGNRREEYDKIQKYLYSEIESTVISRAFKTTYKGDVAYHEVTAGLIDRPFQVFLENFEPAVDWGKNLAGYLGGELVVDEVNEKDQAVLLRERMILKTPWYAVGSPHLDMSKYEYTQYERDSVKVNWVVTKSENNSVLLDIGYLQFIRYVSENSNNLEERTMAVFNSIHRINGGCIINILPGFIQSMMLLITLKDMFSSYIRKYQKILTR
jgi:hypothetical protein